MNVLIEHVAQQFTNEFSNHVKVTIDVGYGEVNGFKRQIYRAQRLATSLSITAPPI
jgi:hypothetical protein